MNMHSQFFHMDSKFQGKEEMSVGEGRNGQRKGGRMPYTHAAGRIVNSRHV